MRPMLGKPQTLSHAEAECLVRLQCIHGRACTDPAYIFRVTALCPARRAAYPLPEQKVLPRCDTWMLVQFPDPVIKIAIEPKTKSDQQRMTDGLLKLAQEDPSFHFSRDDETNQTVIEGMGELHLVRLLTHCLRPWPGGYVLSPMGDEASDHAFYETSLWMS